MPLWQLVQPREVGGRCAAGTGQVFYRQAHSNLEAHCGCHKSLVTRLIGFGAQTLGNSFRTSKSKGPWNKFDLI